MKHKAYLDLGSNTFHLAIVYGQDVVYKTSKAAKLGLGGKNYLDVDAQKRGLEVLSDFKNHINKYNVEINDILAIGTSALRSATNNVEFIELIEKELGFKIQVISGDLEADYIFKGIKKAVIINSPSLIVDIGGGSVEFIICDAERKLWQKSFEIGGLRLMSIFMQTDPISSASISKMHDFFKTELLELHNAVHQYWPTCLIGSSGSFDTLNEMYHQKAFNTSTNEFEVGFNYPVEAFYEAYEALVFNDRNARLVIPGMIPLRVDMIVVAMVLIHYLIKNLSINEIKISKYALLEGLIE